MDEDCFEEGRFVERLNLKEMNKLNVLLILISPLLLFGQKSFEEITFNISDPVESVHRKEYLEYAIGTDSHRNSYFMTFNAKISKENGNYPERVLYAFDSIQKLKFKIALDPFHDVGRLINAVLGNDDVVYLKYEAAENKGSSYYYVPVKQNGEIDFSSKKATLGDVRISSTINASKNGYSRRSLRELIWEFNTIQLEYVGKKREHDILDFESLVIEKDSVGNITVFGLYYTAKRFIFDGSSMTADGRWENDGERVEWIDKEVSGHFKAVLDTNGKIQNFDKRAFNKKERIFSLRSNAITGGRYYLRIIEKEDVIVYVTEDRFVSDSLMDYSSAGEYYNTRILYDPVIYGSLKIMVINKETNETIKYTVYKRQLNNYSGTNTLIIDEGEYLRLVFSDHPSRRRNRKGRKLTSRYGIKLGLLKKPTRVAVVSISLQEEKLEKEFIGKRRKKLWMSSSQYSNYYLNAEKAQIFVFDNRNRVRIIALD